jgi:hypothetical protein
MYLTHGRETQANATEQEKANIRATCEYEAELRIQAEKEQAEARVLAARKELGQLKGAFNG